MVHQKNNYIHHNSNFDLLTLIIYYSVIIYNLRLIIKIITFIILYITLFRSHNQTLINDGKRNYAIHKVYVI